MVEFVLHWVTPGLPLVVIGEIGAGIKAGISRAFIIGDCHYTEVKDVNAVIIIGIAIKHASAPLVAPAAWVAAALVAVLALVALVRRPRRASS